MERAGHDAVALIEAVDYPLALALTDSIVERLREHRLRLFSVHGEPQRGQYHHLRILNAIESHDRGNRRGEKRLAGGTFCPEI
jgi:GntR family transcriptional regulator, transcriptional repressor for pyruvate dehydrogenase complex